MYPPAQPISRVSPMLGRVIGGARGTTELPEKIVRLSFSSVAVPLLAFAGNRWSRDPNASDQRHELSLFFDGHGAA